MPVDEGNVSSFKDSPVWEKALRIACSSNSKAFCSAPVIERIVPSSVFPVAVLKVNTALLSCATEREARALQPRPVKIQATHKIYAAAAKKRDFKSRNQRRDGFADD